MVAYFIDEDQMFFFKKQGSHMFFVFQHQWGRFSSPPGLVGFGGCTKMVCRPDR